VLAVLAFAFGTQERRFFLILYKAAALIVTTPGEEDQDSIQITSITPTTGPANSVLIIEGEGFHPGASVMIGGLEMADVVVGADGTSIAGTVPAQAAAGAVYVTVVNPDNGARRAPKQFTITPPPPPPPPPQPTPTPAPPPTHPSKRVRPTRAR
jgi:hypothetical protein